MILVDRLQRTYTQNYAQPDNYHFCLESVIAAEFISSRLRCSPSRVADIGAGCGVFGLEIAHHFQGAIELDAIELQAEFSEYFQKNSAWMKRAEFFEEDFREFASGSTRRYDLIVGNLPFYNPKNHLLSADSMRNICRFTMNGDLKDMVEAAVKVLAPAGSIYFLSREKCPEGLTEKIKCVAIAQIRKTTLFEITYDSADYCV